MNSKPRFRDTFSADFLIFFVIVIVALIIIFTIAKFSIQSEINQNIRECRIKIGFGISAPIFSASLIMSFWYFMKGKSIKALNDFLLFISAAIGSYYFMLDHEAYLKFHESSILCKNINYMCWQLMLLICSFTKAFIALIEFFQERKILIEKITPKKINSDKELFLHKVALSMIEIIRKKR